jgi:hypothetical protein
MTMRYLLLVLLSLAGPLSGQPLSGFVFSDDNGERLVGAFVATTGGNCTAVTDREGFFSCRSVEPLDTIVVRYLGFQTQRIGVTLLGKPPVRIYLTPENVVGGEIEVTASALDRASEGASVVRFTPQQINNLPSFLGQPDLLKSMQNLPGVSPGDEGKGGVYVRGGSYDQTLILLDGIPLFQMFHSGGFVSVIQSGLLQASSFYTGGFPARYGGRLSSILDLSVKEGNRERTSGSFQLGAVTTDGILEVPVANGSWRILAGGRYSLLDRSMNLFSENIQKRIPITQFNDGLVKLTGDIGARTKVSMTGLFANDQFNSSITEEVESKLIGERARSEATNGTSWRSSGGNVRVRHVTPQGSILSLAVYQSSYRTRNEEEVASYMVTASQKRPTHRYGALYRNGILMRGVQGEMTTTISRGAYVKLGMQVQSGRFSTGALQQYREGEQAADPINQANLSTPAEFMNEGDVYADFQLPITDRLEVAAGLRGQYVSAGGDQWNLQPRLAVTYKPAGYGSVWVSAARMQQNIHLVSNSTFGVAADLWLPTTENLKPSTGWIYVAGGNLEPVRSLLIQTEVWYRSMDRLTEFRQGNSFYQIDGNLAGQLIQGRGEAYGFEFFLRKQQGRLTGTLSYTLSRSTRTFEALNFGRPYRYKFDRTHNVAATASARLGKRWQVHTGWTYFNGALMTLPNGSFMQGWTPFPDPNAETAFSGIAYNNIRQRNNYELPAYHRMDLNLEYTGGGLKRPVTVRAGAYNLYGRQNPVFASVRFFDDNPGIRLYPLFRLVPFASMEIKL